MSELEWLQNAPCSNLLETDIRSKSFNLAPWNGNSTAKDARTTWKSDRLVLENDQFFQNLHIGDTTALEAISERSTCPKCEKSRKYYCYSCYIPLKETASLIPTIPSLPVQIDVIKHPHELDGKSSAIHAKVICPNSVRVFTYPDIPDYQDEKVLVLFPGDKAEKLDDYFPQHLTVPQKRAQFQRILFVDCTWHQVKSICLDDRIINLPQLILDDRQTVFWRNQKGKPKEYLATIEAIYYFLQDYHTKVLGLKYDGEFDKLLFLFKFMHHRLHELYK